LKQIVVVSGKGGVGKTLISSNFSIYLHENGFNVIALDADLEAPNLHLVLGGRVVREYVERGAKRAFIDRDKCIDCLACIATCQFKAIELIEGKPMVIDYLCEGCGACSLVCPREAIVLKDVEPGKLRIMETDYGFPLISGNLALGMRHTGKLVYRAKEMAEGLAKKDGVIVIDSAPGIGCPTIAAISGADLGIVVLEPSLASLQGCERVIKVLEHFKVPYLVILNKYKEEIMKRILDLLHRRGIKVEGMIPYDEHVYRAYVMGKPVIVKYPESPASRALVKLFREVIESAL